ncbi:MAG: type II CRISPR RNA-guided endonuclease Cas9, partial [Sedimentisphaerales bacterium]
MHSYTLGLDIGSNSIGWALIETGKKPSIIDIGIRVFPKGVGTEKENEKTKCAKRREARGARRVHRRQNLRRDQLVKILRGNRLLPEDKKSLQELLLKTEPYQLRAKGLDERLELFEFGRALFHINKRRGFKSNRKTGEANEKSKIAKGDKEHKGANEIEKVIDERKFRTIGEYFASIDTTQRQIRGQYTFRSMYENEFDLLWEKQSEYHPKVLTEDLKEKIKDEVIFFQRPVRWDPETIGDCELEEGEKRCPRGDWFARRFRILQDVNNMKIRNADGSEIELTDEQRSIILKELGKKKKVKFERLKKELSKQDVGLIEKQRFNFEEDGDNNWMNGDGFSEQMRSKKLLGPKGWEDLDKKTKIAMNQALHAIYDKEKTINEFGFNKEQAGAFIEVRLERNYMRYSKKAILKLLPHMEKGLKTHKAKEEAGYKEGSEKTEQSTGRLPKPDDLRNPIVTAALNEVRRLVNRIVCEYDKPKKIVIEMARELKNTKLARKKTLEKNRNNQKLNEEARSWIIEHTSIKSPRYGDILKYKLWIECNKTCLYTGKSISPTELFESPVFQIEHILPHERSGDDSYMNKTLCYVDENVHVKGGKTPFEAYHGKPEKYELIRQRISCLPQAKKERFLQEEIREGHIERELNDTRY